MTQPGKFVNSVSREKTKFKFQECEEMHTGKPRRSDSNTNCIRCSVRAPELTQREQKEFGLIETNMKVDPEDGNIHRSTRSRGAWPVDLLAVAMMNSPAEALRAGLGTVERIIARWLQAQICSNREAILEPTTVQTLRLAGLLIFQVGAEKTDQYMKTNKEKPTGLAPRWSKGVFGSLGGWVTRGRLGKGIFSILGVHKLPILLPESRLAYLLMLQAHEEAHKGSKITLWRSRSKAWVVKGKNLAVKVDNASSAGLAKTSWDLRWSRRWSTRGPRCRCGRS